MHVKQAVWVGRIGYMLTLLFLATFLGYASRKGGRPELSSFGGLSMCFQCLNGWNWHGLIFTVAFGILMPESFFIFYARMPRVVHDTRKQIHLTLQGLAVVISTAGIIAIVKARQAQQAHMMFSLHSWRGAITMSLVAIQFASGLFVFVFLKPYLTDDLRASIMRYHRFLGKLTFFAGLGTAINGWAEYQMLMAKNGQPSYSAATLMPVGVGLSLWVVCAAVGYLMLWHEGKPPAILWRDNGLCQLPTTTQDTVAMDKKHENALFIKGEQQLGQNLV